MSNVIKTVPDYTGPQRPEEEQVTGTKVDGESGEKKNALDVFIRGGFPEPEDGAMFCESGVIDLEGGVELTVNTTKFKQQICSVEFFDDTMNKILISYRVLGMNQFRVTSNRDITAVSWKAQGA